MYVLIENNPPKASTFKTKKDLANYLGVHFNTVTNNIGEGKKIWHSDKGTIYISVDYASSRSGNKDSYEVKKAKARGEIELKSPKKI